LTPKTLGITLKPLALLAALFSSLVLLIVFYISLKPAPKSPEKMALPPVELAPPVREINPQNPNSTTPSFQKPDAPLPKGVELIRNETLFNPNVRKMRERLIEAASSGNINRLNIVFQTNETMPIFTRGNERDPISFWKKSSGDGQGREILSALANIMAMPAALIYKGTPQEMYVWPYLAHMPLKDLSPAQEVDLYKLVTAQDVKEMATFGKWVFWRVGIGPDGTLHYFVAGE
jgi:hypothetical protein